jgi:hypothetical protein
MSVVGGGVMCKALNRLPANIARLMRASPSPAASSNMVLLLQWGVCGAGCSRL